MIFFSKITLTTLFLCNSQENKQTKRKPSSFHNTYDLIFQLVLKLDRLKTNPPTYETIGTRVKEISRKVSESGELLRLSCWKHQFSPLAFRGWFRMLTSSANLINEPFRFVMARWPHSVTSALSYGSSSLGSSRGWRCCIVFLIKTLYSHSASLHPGLYKWVPAGMYCWK